MKAVAANFDGIARAYRWLEYLTLGRALERCRTHFLPLLADRRQALVLGDGDGRFLAALMAQNPTLNVDAVDTSAAMLRLLRERCEREARVSEHRLRVHHADALRYVAEAREPACDLVVTHFFLDCLKQPAVDELVAGVAVKLAPDALWVVSDFRIPHGAMRLPARVLVSGLYLAFRILTGLRTDRLPDHASTLGSAGFGCIARQHSLFGVLTTELWSRG